MAVLLTKNGALDPTFDGDGRLLLDLGGPSDSFFGVALSADKKQALVAGWKGAAMATGDDGVVVRLLP